MEIKNSELEVIVEFTHGRMIPRRVRYYDLMRAVYVEKDIKRISYEVIDYKGSRYGIRFYDNQSGILSFIQNSGHWHFVEHL